MSVIRVLTVLVMGYLILPILVILPLSFTSGELLVLSPARLVAPVVPRVHGGAHVDAGHLEQSSVLAAVTTLGRPRAGMLAAFGLQGPAQPAQARALRALALPSSSRR